MVFGFLLHINKQRSRFAVYVRGGNVERSMNDFFFFFSFNSCTQCIAFNGDACAYYYTNNNNENILLSSGVRYLLIYYVIRRRYCFFRVYSVIEHAPSRTKCAQTLQDFLLGKKIYFFPRKIFIYFRPGGGWEEGFLNTRAFPQMSSSYLTRRSLYVDDRIPTSHPIAEHLTRPSRFYAL